MQKRLFIAIELPEELKKNLRKVQKRLKDLKAKWVKASHMHLTLAFLGEVEELREPEISEICQKIAIKYKSFEICLFDLSSFPKKEYAHTIWAKIKKSDQLLRLQKELSRELGQNKFIIEKRPYVPHLTVARLKKPINIIEHFKKNIFWK